MKISVILTLVAAGWALGACAKRPKMWPQRASKSRVRDHELGIGIESIEHLLHGLPGEPIALDRLHDLQHYRQHLEDEEESFHALPFQDGQQRKRCLGRARARLADPQRGRLPGPATDASSNRGPP